MELKITTTQALKGLQVLAWIIFIGLCVEAGSIVFSAVYTFATKGTASSHSWEGADLSALYHYDPGHFAAVSLFMTIVAVLKAILFYLIIKLFLGKKLSLAQPFSAVLKWFLISASSLALVIGLCSGSGCAYVLWLSEQKVAMPDPRSLHLAGADVWLFMAVILFLVAQVVKRGIDMQHENDLTI